VGDARLHFAVGGSPDGEAVFLPRDRETAHEIRDRFSGDFFCAAAAHGCGGRLELKAGPVIPPYFAHRAGTGPGCMFRADGPGAGDGQARRAYLHLFCQQLLKAWLDRQDLTARIETVLGPDSRTDLHVVVDQVRHALEIQLSPITAETVTDREQRYHRHVQHVNWLFGDDARAAAGRQENAEGRSLRVHLVEDHADPASGPGDDRPVGYRMQIGTKAYAHDTHWAELDECRMTPNGLWTPHLATAAAETDQARERERTRAARAAEQDTTRTHRHQPRAEPVVPAGPTAPAGLGIGRGIGRVTWTLPDQLATFPELEEWAAGRDQAWLAGLPADLRPAARFLAYYTGHLAAAGPLDRLALDDVPDPDRKIPQALTDAGLITVTTGRPAGRAGRWFRPR
jgi:hypothetical protein